MLTKALRALEDAIEELADDPGLEDEYSRLREVRDTLAARFARRVQGEIFSEQLILPERMPDSVDLEPAGTC